MKKYLFIFTIIISSLFIIDCGNEKMNIQYEPSPEHDIFPNKQTFLFTGESEHIYFTTGKFCYGEDELGLLITNFKTKDTIKEGATFTAPNVYFNERIFACDVNVDSPATLTNLSGIVIGEFGGYQEYNDKGEITGESDSL